MQRVERISGSTRRPGVAVACLALPMLLPMLLAVLLTAPTVAAAKAEFPLRAFYPEVATISTDQLMARYDECVIVDIRSRFEYDVARINKARLLPLADKDFEPKLERIRGPKDPAPLVFYCNGHTCAKSYKASQRALAMGFDDVYCYDGGIFDWIMAAPERATLMGRTPATSERIITDEEFAHSKVDYAAFRELAQDPRAVVVDIRDPFQRDLEPRLDHIRNIPLDPLLELVVSRIWTEKKLLFFDAVGKQVRWLQYYLESYGYYNYAFLEGGIRAIADDAALVRPANERQKKVKSFQTSLLGLTGDTALTLAEARVLLFLMGSVKFDNYGAEPMDDVTAATGLSRAAATPALARLKAREYLEYELMGDTVVYQMEPHLCWKGDTGSDKFHDETADFEEDVP